MVLSVSEKFNFGALLHVRDDRPFREKLVGAIGEIFFCWLHFPKRVVLLNCRTGISKKSYWSELEPLRATELSDDDILFIHYGLHNDLKNNYSILSMSKNNGMYIYTLSVPLLCVEESFDKIPNLALCLGITISNFCADSTIVAGAEVEVDETILSFGDLVNSLDKVGSLVEWVSCEEKRAADIKGFYVVEKRDGFVVKKRQVFP